MANSVKVPVTSAVTSEFRNFGRNFGRNFVTSSYRTCSRTLFSHTPDLRTILLFYALRLAMDREPPCYATMMRGIRLIGLAVCHLSHSTRPKGPRTQNTLHWTRFLPSTMHARSRGSGDLVSPETRPGLLEGRHPNDLTRTSNTPSRSNSAHP